DPSVENQTRSTGPEASPASPKSMEELPIRRQSIEYAGVVAGWLKAGRANKTDAAARKWSGPSLRLGILRCRLRCRRRVSGFLSLSRSVSRLDIRCVYCTPVLSAGEAGSC